MGAGETTVEGGWISTGEGEEEGAEDAMGWAVLRTIRLEKGIEDEPSMEGGVPGRVGSGGSEEAKEGGGAVGGAGADDPEG